MAETRSKAEEHLDRADRLLAEARGKTEPDADSEWDIDTARHEIEEIKKAVAARPPMPTPVQVVIAQKPGSDPPVSGSLDIGRRGLRTGKLPPWATVVIALATIGAIAWAFVKTH